MLEMFLIFYLNLAHEELAKGNRNLINNVLMALENSTTRWDDFGESLFRLVNDFLFFDVELGPVERASSRFA